jgi:hypothetical protein
MRICGTETREDAADQLVETWSSLKRRCSLKSEVWCFLSEHLRISLPSSKTLGPKWVPAGVAFKCTIRRRAHCSCLVLVPPATVHVVKVVLSFLPASRPRHTDLGIVVVLIVFSAKISAVSRVFSVAVFLHGRRIAVDAMWSLPSSSSSNSLVTPASPLAA